MAYVRLYSSMPVKRHNVAMILHGCGVYDGTEIHEATSMLIHLSKLNVNVSLFAPNINQMHVVNHLDGSVMKETRNVLVESARIARGKVSPLSELNVKDFDALLIPGGFGVAKNLSDFAEKNADCTVIQDVELCLKGFLREKKPIGLCCIAPVLAAKCCPGAELTMGGVTEQNGRWPFAGASAAAKQMGAKIVPREVNDIQVDEERKIVTGCAYMCGTASVGEVFDGIGRIVDAVVHM